IKRGGAKVLRVSVAGVSGWTGGAVARAILSSDEFELTGAVAGRQAGRDAGELLGLPASGGIVAALVVTPSGHERFFAGVGHEATGRAPGPPPVTPVDIERLVAVAPGYGIEIQSPG